MPLDVELEVDAEFIEDEPDGMREDEAVVLETPAMAGGNGDEEVTADEDAVDELAPDGGGAGTKEEEATRLATMELPPEGMAVAVAAFPSLLKMAALAAAEGAVLDVLLSCLLAPRPSMLCKKVWQDWS